MADYYLKDYGTPMDRNYYGVNAYGNPDLSAPWAESIEIGKIGISTPPMKDQLQSLKARIFQGAQKVELGFMGKGKGSKSQGATTPEQIGMDERMDIKKLAELNKVKLSAHVTTAVGNLSGFTERGFSEEAREKAMHEIKRTIDLAADVTQGGPVVVHLGEFPRAFSEQEYWGKTSEGQPKFLMYPTEEEHAKQFVVDGRTGMFIGEISKDLELFEPKWMTAKDYEEELRKEGKQVSIIGKRDEKTGRVIREDDWVDNEGNIIPHDSPPEELFRRRVPIWNPKKEQFETVKRDWSYFKQKADEWNKLHPDNPKTPAIIFAETQIDSQILQSKGMALYHTGEYERYRDLLQKLKEAYKEYQKLEEAIPEEKKWKIALQRAGLGGEVGRLLPPETQMPTEALQEAIKNIERHLRTIHEAATSYDTRAMEALERKKHLKPLEDYAKEKTADTLARAAEYAMAKSRKLKQPLYISPENIFPEFYGSHPEELRETILEARKKFAENLLKKKMAKNEKEAKALAEKHIKATFDLGHAYIWRKYFQGSDEEFKKWLFREVDKHTKDNVVGHIHVSDNFGYEDEHVTPGQVLVPIKEIIAKFKKAGVEDIIVEPAEQDYLAMLGGWKVIGGPLYGVAPGALGWTDIEHSYFGRTAPPYFLYGDAAPGPDWQLWSGVRLE